MRWLLDQGIPRSAITGLRAAGFSAEHVGDLGMSKALDCEILEKAVRENWIVVTLDADFHSILALSGNSAPSVVRIREEGLKGDSIARILNAIAKVAETPLTEGCVISYAEGNLRLRMLPITRHRE